MRHYKDWLAAFLDYASYGEAPQHMYFWAGVSAVAGALRRKVWIDQVYFKWHPNFYICFVAPPGIVSKTTTVGVAMSLLRQVEGINFGPDVITMQALSVAFEAATEAFELDGEYMPMSALTFESGEFGNLLDPRDKAMVDLLVSLWDGKTGSFKKVTKTSGSEEVQNPWINLIACTTPAWIAGNFPQYMIGGGFTSRTIFVYAEKKKKLVAYVNSHVPKTLKETEKKLVEDLTEISHMAGEYKLTADAIAWGEAWYADHYASKSIHLDPEYFGGYIARKQTHIHKLAMVLAACESDNLVITSEHLSTASLMVTDLEPDMGRVFQRIGRSEVSLATERLITFVHSRKKVPYAEAYRQVYPQFPSARDYTDALDGCIKAGYIKLVHVGGVVELHAGIEPAGQL